MLKYSLEEMNKQIDKYKDLSHPDLFQHCINHKLAQTLETYNEIIDKNSSYLLTRSAFKIMKAITKIQIKEDKKRIKEEIEND